MNEKDKDYITRLIAGVREKADKEMKFRHGEKCIPAKWLDAVLLCDVIEKEVLRVNYGN